MDKMKREELSPNLLEKCQVCAYGGRYIFPDCVDFDPIENCAYFDDISDDDITSEDYVCPTYMHIDKYNELINLLEQ